MSNEKIRIERRKTPRFSTSIEALTKNSQGLRQRVEISDLAETGCAVLVEGQPLKVGSSYSLKTQGMEALGCSVAWSSGNSAGLIFQHPLHPSVARHLVSLYPPWLKGEIEQQAAG